MFSRELNPGLGRSGSVTPQLEPLEERCCPSTVKLLNHTLTLTGDAHDSLMIVGDDGRGDFKVTLNGHLNWFSGVQKVVINSTTGNDTIDYTLTGALTTSEQLNLNLGNGSDQVRLNFKQNITAHSLAITVNGDGGDQDVSAEFGKITNTQLHLAANLGNGWDHFAASFNGDLAGTANADVNVHGGRGIEGVNIQAHGNIQANARLSVETYLGTANNSVHVDYTGQLDGHLSVLEKGGPSWNWMESHINLTPGSNGWLYVRELGGVDSNLLDLQINAGHNHLRQLDAQINGGTGWNTSVHTSNVRVINGGN
jgi:hypothetical protein